jgi:two-component system, LytTR family, sensor kinase
MLGFDLMKRSLRTTATALAAASVLAFFEIMRTTLTRVLEGLPLTLPEFVFGVIPMWITVVLASPWCAFMAGRFPLRAGRMGRALLAHLGGGAVFVALQTSLMISIHMLHGATHVLPWTGIVHRYFFYIAMELSLYAVIVMVVLLLDARREASERELASARLEQGLAAARLEGLQAQIRPHFLFNTLNALAVLARKGDGAAVDRAIGDLGELLRASFDSSGRHEIPLGEELEFLERYVSLQRIRFPDRLDVRWEIDDDARHALVPALVVQPLVENAIEHGLGTVRGGRVRVSARHDGDTLAIAVSDDGPGFGVDTVRREGIPPARDGVGLANTRERLTLLYGARGSLECGNRPEGGGEVQIRIPWRAAPTEPPA